MKNKFRLCISVILTLFVSIYFVEGHAQTVASKQLVKKWETSPGILTPESVLWDAQNQFFYVSDINGSGSAKDGNGFISKINPEGEIIKLHWVDGLDSPKGMGSAHGKLFVADLDRLVIIDISQREILKKIVLPGASFLNDIATDKNGNVFISDSKQGIIYKYASGKASVYLDDPKINGANGLLVWRNLLWIQGSNGLYQYNPKEKSLLLFTDAVKSCDGITVVNNRDFIVSRWQGQVYYVKADGSAVKILDVMNQDKNTADLFYLPKRNLLIIPTFNGNVVMGYELKQ